MSNNRIMPFILLTKNKKSNLPRIESVEFSSFETPLELIWILKSKQILLFLKSTS